MTRLHMLFAPGITHPRYRTTAWYETHASLREQIRRDQLRKRKTKREKHLQTSRDFKQIGGTP